MIDEAAIENLHIDMRQWRRHLHQFPETAFEEFATANYIAEKLGSFGLEIHRGLGKTGVVGILSAGNSDKRIALRADMDALNIHELNTFAHKSCHEGKMHACGHDGHTAMLLGAAKYLAECKNFAGTVYFIFQPAEEGRAGAKQMIDDGLFVKFPANSVYGMHNFPDIPAGHFAIKAGPMMASFDCFEIILNGQACHAAMPNRGNDPIIAATQLINSLQTIVSRSIDPAESAVVSITQIHAGNTWNAIPDSVVIRGTYRCFNDQVRRLIANKIEQLLDGTCRSFGLDSNLVFNPENPGYPVTINAEAESLAALKAAVATVGEQNVITQPIPSMGSEDFAFMLKEKPGCYVWIGNGASNNSCLLHNPNYDFNDAILSVGAKFWITLVHNHFHYK